MPPYPNSFLVSCYSDILNGYSIAYIGEKGKRQQIYVKHFDYKDIQALEEEKKLREEYLRERGIKSEEEIKKEMAKQKKWTPKDDDELKEIDEWIGQLTETQRKTTLEAQRNAQQKEIDAQKDKYNKKRGQLNLLLAGRTREFFLDIAENNYYVFLSFYYDKEFKKKVFDENKRKELDDDEFSKFVGIYRNTAGLIDGKVIKHIALKSFFLDSYRLAKSPFDFMGRPICGFTQYQTALCSWGDTFKHILSRIDENATEEDKKDPDKLLEYYEIQVNIEKSKAQEGASDGKWSPNTKYMNANPNDYQRMGKSGINQAYIESRLKK